MNFNRAELTCYRTNFPYHSSSLQNAAFSYTILHLTYIRGWILELRRDFPIDWQESISLHICTVWFPPEEMLTKEHSSRL